MITALTGCASTAAAPESTLGAARLAIAAVQVPPPPEHGSSVVIAAWNALRAESLQTALEVASGVPLAESSTSAARALAGFVALRRGDLTAAQDAFGAALGAESDMPEAAYGMGLVAQKRGRTDLARQWFGAALRQAPGMSRASVALRRIDLQAVDSVLAAAESARSGGDMEGAEQHYREANGLAPGVEGPYLQLAALYQVQGDEGRAIAILSEGLRNVGDSPGLLEPLAVLYGEAGRLAEASDTFDRLRQALPGDERAMRLARAARERYEMASLPLEYRALQARAEISREELAAILAINLARLEPMIESRRRVIITDTPPGWSAPFVQRMVEWGVLDVYQNDFMPQMVVRRSMLVEAAYRVLEILGVADTAPRPALDDPPPEHLLYRPTQAVVGLGLMQTDGDGSFDLLAPVSGAEALRTVERLAALVRRSIG